MARIVRFSEYGDSSVMKIVEENVREPGRGEVRFKVEAIGLNRAEVLFRAGRYPLQQADFPSRNGYEASGVVDAVGADVSHVRPGDHVGTVPSFRLSEYGVYGEQAVVPAHAVVLSPDKLSAAEATAVWSPYVTAYGALIEIARINADSRVVITAASSSIGVAALQVCKAAGAQAIAATRTAGKRQALLDRGADGVVVTDDEDLVERIMELTGGRGHTVSFDPVVGPLLTQLAQAASPNAILFVYGGLDKSDAIFPRGPILGKGLWVRGYTLFPIVADAAAFARAQDYVYGGLKRGTLKPVIAREFQGLDQLAAAHDYMERNRHLGKLVVTL